MLECWNAGIDEAGSGNGEEKRLTVRPSDGLPVPPSHCPTVLLLFTIRDTGIGIPEDKQDRLFKSFSQVDASTTRQFGGTGLGLAISRQLAELMGGEIGVDSAPGQGTTFWFTVRLPLAEAGQHEPLAAADLEGVRALVVDDNATNREVLLARLLSWGMRPDEAPDGPTALRHIYAARAENDPYRLAVLDMLMPGMDGETLARAIRADANLADLKLALMTSAGGVRGDARRFEQAGFSVFLTKPVRHSDLHDSLTLALAGPDSARIITRHTARESRRTALPDFFRSRARILVAEDNPVNQQVAVGVLRKMGLSADVAANGLEVLAALQTIPYDLVLMDVQMPEMDGLTATREIRRRENDNAGMLEYWDAGIGKTGRNAGMPVSQLQVSGLIPHPSRRTPVIAMTAGAMQQDREECYAAGMDDYLAKPVDPFRLAEVLQQWLPGKDRSRMSDDGSRKEEGGRRKTEDSSRKAEGESRTAEDQAEHPDKTPPEAGTGEPCAHNPDAGRTEGPETDSDLPVFDKPTLLRRLGGDEKLVVQIAQGFLNQNANRLGDLLCSINQEDSAQVRAHAHFLRGSSLTIGAETFADLNRRLEQAAAAEDIPTVKKLGTLLEREFQRLAEILRREIG